MQNYQKFYTFASDDCYYKLVVEAYNVDGVLNDRGFHTLYKLTNIDVDITNRSLPLRLALVSPRPDPFRTVATIITLTKFTFGRF